LFAVDRGDAGQVKMATYVYQCKKGHVIEISHGMNEIVGLWCAECGERMHRKPQRFRFYNNPVDTLLRKYGEEKFNEYKRRTANGRRK
jgi:hypothetical protein